jgi:hypothetical protein
VRPLGGLLLVRQEKPSAERPRCNAPKQGQIGSGVATMVPSRTKTSEKYGAKKRRKIVKQVTDHPLINSNICVRSCRTIWLDLSLKITLAGHVRSYQKLSGQAFSGLLRQSAHNNGGDYFFE